MSLLALLKAKKQDLAAGKRRKTVKPTDGTTRWRILPSWRGAGQQFWHDFGQHFVKNAAKEITAIYMCTDKTFGKPCAVCEAVSQGMKAATDDHTMEILKDARSTGRILLNALHLDGPTPTEVQVLELPPTVFNMLIEIAEEWEAADDSVFDIAKGKDILIGRTGTGKTTKYTVQVGAKVTPVPAGVMDKLHDLDEYVAQESNERQLRALNSVRSVSGLLAAPSSSSTPTPRPLAAAAAAPIEEDDPYAVATPPARKAAPAPAAAVADEVTDVVDVAPKPVPKAAPAPAPKAAAVVAAESTGDSDLDDLLNQLGA